MCIDVIIKKVYIIKTVLYIINVCMCIDVIIKMVLYIINVYVYRCYSKDGIIYNKDGIIYMIYNKCILPDSRAGLV